MPLGYMTKTMLSVIEKSGKISHILSLVFYCELISSFSPFHRHVLCVAMLFKGKLSHTSVMLCILLKIQKDVCTHYWSKNAHFHNVLIKVSPVRALIPSNHFKVLQ